MLHQPTPPAEVNVTLSSTKWSWTCVFHLPAIEVDFLVARTRLLRLNLSPCIKSPFLPTTPPS